MFLGSRTAANSWIVCTTDSPLARFMKKKSLFLTFRTGSSPWLTACAFMTIRLSCACRKISVRRTVFTTPLRMRSENRLPAPTEGSWSGSPTSSRRQPCGSACKSEAISCRSTMEVSSMIMASVLSGSSSS